MNRRNYLKTGTLALVTTALHIQTSSAAEENMIGKMTADQFATVNKQAAAKVEALKTGAGKLADADAALLGEIASGGMMQLELSKVAVERSKSKDVKTIAAAEVAEQTVLAAKLKQIADRGSLTLPKSPDTKTAMLVEQLKKLSGEEFDKTYLKEVGVRGHEMLRATMSKVSSGASDSALKELASTALPLIETHLQVATDEAASMS